MSDYPAIYRPREDVTLYLGDCLHILPTLTGIDAVITDPPYEIIATGAGIGAKRQYLRRTAGFTDCGFDYRVLSQFDNWVCFGSLKQVPKLIEHVADRRWMLVTWNKPNPTPLSNGNYLPDTEYIIHAWRGKLHGEYSDKARFIVHPAGDTEGGNHPNEKPVRVVTKMIRMASAPGATVCDPYAGSGTTGIACIRTGRRFIGIEIDPTHYATACKRIDNELQRMTLPMEVNG